MAPGSSLDSAGLAVNLVNDLTLCFDRGQPVADSPAELRRRCTEILHAEASRQDVEDLRRLAVLLRPVFQTPGQADDDHAVPIVNSMLGRYPCDPRLIAVPGHGWTLQLSDPDTPRTVAGVGAHVAGALAVLIDSRDIDRLRACDADRYDRVFVDQSRKRHQRFCGQRCMSRSKVAAWRARKSTVDSR